LISSSLGIGLYQHVKEHHRNRLSDFDDAKEKQKWEVLKK